jgi:flagellar protein FlaF
MGFSVSGAAAVIFAAMFISFGMWYTASANSFEQVTEAKADRTDAAVETMSADVEITSATYNASGNEELVVAVNNTGATQLDLDSTDLLVDGEYRSGWQGAATVDGNADTRLWLGAEQLRITLSLPARPDRVKIVTETGISDTAEVSAQ